ncbi:CsbD family protein [Streptomyces sp. NPDC046203]|uniref:CsbD family protein n=1 Tax=Streptomyces sp. NPDC046203 TaxID=3154602 RepID=UPI0033D7D93B
MTSAMDKAKGRLKEVAGRFTGDERLESEGRTDQAKAKVRDAVGGLRDRAAGIVDSLRRHDRHR